MLDTAQQTDRNPQAADRLKWIQGARDHWERTNKAIEGARQVAAGKVRSDQTGEQVERVNLAVSTLEALVPHIYARNPEFAGTPKPIVPPEKLAMVRSFGKTAANILNHLYDETDLKGYAKRALRGALTSRVGWVKQIWQRDYQEDPVAVGRIEDAQNELETIRATMERMDDPTIDPEALEVRRSELEQLIAAQEKNREIMVAEGLALSVARPEHIVLDPAIDSIEDWWQSRRIVHLIPMPREKAENHLGMRLSNARTFGYASAYGRGGSGGGKDEGGIDPIVMIMEEWDRELRTVYTYVDGETEYVREPYTPDVLAERFYPFHPLWFHLVDGEQYPRSLIELLAPLFEEYNDVREQQAGHRSISKPHWIAHADTDQSSLRRYTDAELGEVVLIDSSGRPLRESIEVANPPPYNPAIYDTSPIRTDINELSGVQDAARGAVNRAKTATEAEILQQGLVDRAGATRDDSEDWLSDMGRAGLELAMQAMNPDQVAALAGAAAAHVWPMMVASARNIYEHTEIKVRAGSTGKPNLAREQQNWREALPLILQAQDRIRMALAQGMSPAPDIEALRETLRRIDENLEVEPYIPPEALAVMQMQEQAGAGGMPAPAPMAGPAPADPTGPPSLAVVQ